MREIIAAPTDSPETRAQGSNVSLRLWCADCRRVHYIEYISRAHSFDYAFKQAISHFEICRQLTRCSLIINGEIVQDYWLHKRNLDARLRYLTKKYERGIHIIGICSVVYTLISIFLFKSKGITLALNLTSLILFSILIIGELHFNYDWNFLKYFKFLVKKLK